MKLGDLNRDVVLSILSYSFCSGTLVLLNKLTLFYLPFPSLVVVFQLVACLFIIYGAHAAGYISVDPIQWEYVKPYLLYIFFFSTGVYCNMRSLNVSNVETVIVFRALSPVVVAFLDALFLGREWPSKRSWAGLCTLVIGAYGYASQDEKFQTQGMGAYFWPTLYTIIIALEMAYGKSIVKSVPLKTSSGPVIYTNLLGIVPMMLLATVGKEYSKFWDFWWSHSDYHIPPMSIPYLIVGAIVGTGIGFSGWWCRSVVSATSFTLIGVINKCLTILLNVAVWDKHASPGGIFSLFICITGGIIYEQSPMRGQNQAAAALPAPGDDAFEADGSEEGTADTDEEVALIEKDNRTTKRRG